MLKFLAGALAIIMIIAGFAAIVKHSDFSDITVFISNIFEESSKAPAGDSSGSDSEDDSTGDTSEDTESKCYYFDSDLGVFCEIGLTQGLHHEYRYNCSCGMILFSDITFDHHCPDCGESISKENFVSNPDYDDSVDWESCSVYARCFDNSIDTFIDPMACFASERIYFQYMARCPGTSCNVVMLCDYAYDVVCPDCHVSIGETDFVLNSDWDGETVSYCCPLLYHHDGYSSERIDPLEGCPCGYEYQVQCSCGRIYCFYGEEDITVGCYYCEKQIWPDDSNTGDDSGDDPEDSVPYYYWDGAVFVACSKEYTANYYYYMEHDCGALYYWNTGDNPFGDCLYCGNYIMSYDIEVNPDYNG